MDATCQDALKARLATEKCTRLQDPLCIAIHFNVLFVGVRLFARAHSHTLRVLSLRLA